MISRLFILAYSTLKFINTLNELPSKSYATIILKPFIEMTIERLNQIIRNRRSVYPPSYNTKDIPDEQIETILENANFAPTHKLTEPWRFIIFKAAGKEQLASFLRERYKRITDPVAFSQTKYNAASDKVDKSNCVIVIMMQTHNDKIPEWEEVASVGCAVQNMWLTASAMGIGAYWSSPSFLPDLAEYLELPEGQKCLGVFYMGNHDKSDISFKRTPIANKVKWIKGE